jgi:hypothetical protein
MAFRSWVWVGLIAACLAIVPSGTASRAQFTTGLKGTVLAAPTEPVCMPRVPCMRPAAGAVLAFTQGDLVRKRVATAADGTYRVLLRPGRYGIRVTRPATHRVSPIQVRVDAGQIRRVNVYIDTGLR